MEITRTGGEKMRSYCLHCTLKHIGKAVILLSEAKLGYPEHLYLAIGNLSEAEDECLIEHPELAEQIREIRLEIEDDIKEGEKLITLIIDIMNEYGDEI
jgi:hypothetical protein